MDWRNKVIINNSKFMRNIDLPVVLTELLRAGGVVLIVVLVLVHLFVLLDIGTSSCVCLSHKLH